MTIESVYRAYLETGAESSTPELDEAAADIMDALSEAGASTATLMRAEETINRMLDLQEAEAFAAGFRAAFGLVLDAICAPGLDG